MRPRALTAVDPNRGLLEDEVDLEPSIVSASTGTHSALARAIRKEPGPISHETLIRLIQTEDREVQGDTLEAMASNPDARFLPFLLPLLGYSELREAARKAILAIGAETLDALDEALGDPATPRKVRRRIPHTIIRFEPERAVEVLSRHLGRESDGSVRLKILRALSRLRVTHPDTTIDEALLDEQLHRSLERIVQLLRWRSAVEENALADSTDAELLIVALRDKEKAALERAFWLMGLRYPSENLSLVWRGVQSANPGLQSASVEVLEAVLSSGPREAVLAILDTGEPSAQRARAAHL